MLILYKNNNKANIIEYITLLTFVISIQINFIFLMVLSSKVKAAD